MEEPILIGDELSDDSASNISDEYHTPNHSDDHDNDNNTTPNIRNSTDRHIIYNALHDSDVEEVEEEDEDQDHGLDVSGETV